MFTPSDRASHSRKVHLISSHVKPCADIGDDAQNNLQTLCVQILNFNKTYIFYYNVLAYRSDLR